jgi:hypothetical protein
MSGHHYFREFAYCDSGMIPWVVLAQHLSRTGKTLSSLVDERIKLFPSSGEINRRIADPKAAVDAGPAALPAGLGQDRDGGRAIDRASTLALQPPELEHRAARQAECRVAARHCAHAGKDRRDPRPARQFT